MIDLTILSISSFNFHIAHFVCQFFVEIQSKIYSRQIIPRRSRIFERQFLNHPLFYSIFILEHFQRTNISCQYFSSIRLLIRFILFDRKVRERIAKLAGLASCVSTMVDDEEQEEFRCTGSDVEIEEYTDTEDSPYVAYQATDKLFDTDRATWQKFSFIATLLTVVVSITFLIITYPLYLESVSYVSNAYTGIYIYMYIWESGRLNLSSLAAHAISLSF